MPVHQSIQNLADIALLNIVKNIEYWSGNFLSDFGKNLENVKFVIGPFDCLTPENCWDLIIELAIRKVLKKHHIYLLVSPYLKSLNLNAIRDVSKVKLILELAIIRCQRLQRLVLKHSNDFTNIFLPNVDILSNLKELELPETRLSNHDVSIIGLHAVNLQVLNLMDSRCGNAGLRSLFQKVDASGKEDEHYGNCNKISHLDIRGTDVTPDCVVDIYSIREKEWVCIRVDKTFDVLLRIMTTTDIGHFKTDYLSYLPDVPSETSLEGYIQSALCLSPLASEVCLWDLNIEDGRSIGDFRHLANIRSLTVDIRQGFEMPSAEEDFIFDQGLCPLFWSHGKHLTSLMLTFVRNLDLGVLVSQCSALESLKLQYNVYSNATTSFQIEDGWPLKTLVLLCCSHPGAGVTLNSPDSQVLKLILARAINVEKLVVSYCKSFVDEVIFWASKHNSFHNLTDLMLTNCRYITMNALEESLLLRRDVPLENVLFFGCDEITLADIQKYKKYIEREKYKVQVDWQ